MEEGTINSGTFFLINEEDNIIYQTGLVPPIHLLPPHLVSECRPVELYRPIQFSSVNLRTTQSESAQAGTYI